VAGDGGAWLEGVGGPAGELERVVVDGELGPGDTVECGGGCGVDGCELEGCGVDGCEGGCEVDVGVGVVV
jgi:hypothetical protein